ncbi:MAG: molybdenum cofactor guanylyltransferase [Clostridium sp.]|nr:molybdenum cofactor guanylyltransferase [Clostridium sp.]
MEQTMSILILAGGKSSRMDYKDKACLPLGNDTFLSSLYKRLKPYTEQIIISEGKMTRRDYGADFANVCFVRDIYEDCGPLGGLYTGLKECRNDLCFVAACDMPYLEYALYEYLFGFVTDEVDAVIPLLEGRKQPLAGIYKKRLEPKVKEQLDSKDNTMKHFLDTISVKYVEVGDQERYRAMLQNINTTEEYKELKKHEGSN